MEKLMDHCGTRSGGRRAWLTLILRFCILQGTSARNACCARPEASGARQEAASRLVAASELEHGKLRLASSKRRRARVTEDGGGVRAADRTLQLPSSKRCPARVTEDGGGVRAADRMLRLPSSKGCAAA
ncbi:hypothetical protein PF004_g19303 [Phytophthora fragariae]|uniref:Uncharacterized protein n=1 Tax=Phytophthora fragariae TaxID=53985 RepID=A0A6G0N966_9STRA|nr:hypothetical protein PF004_g19303 [Phytophthora fragariae]